MTLVNLAVLLREFQVRNLPVGRVSVEAVDADGAHVAIAGRNVTFSIRAEVAVVDGQPVAPIVLDPTDGTYCIRWRIYAPDESLMLTRYTAIPDQAEVDFGALVLVSPADFQPTEDVVAAWHVVVAAANAAAAAAALSASQALASRNAAKASETLSGQNAARAIDAADAASEEFENTRSQRVLAQNAAGQALTYRNQAGDSETSAADSSAFAYQASIEAGARKVEAEAARTGAETARAGAETARAGAETAQAGSEGARNQAQTYRDQALAGQFAGTNLGTANLDTILTPGVYWQSVPSNATTANNYPVALDPNGVLEVYRIGANAAVIQRWTPHSANITRAGNVFYERVLNSGTGFNAWRAYTGQRVDESVGRRVFTYNNVTGVEQMIYGDTGWRDIGATNLQNGWTVGSGYARIRRVGSTVYFSVSDLDPAAQTATTFAGIPTGFNPNQTELMLFSTVTTPATLYRAYVSSGGGMSLGTPIPTAKLYYSGSWATSAGWPTSLPGTANGVIPTG